MKIKLNASSDMARKIAMCFVGSSVYCKRTDMSNVSIVAITDDGSDDYSFVVRVVYDGFPNLALTDNVTLDLSTAKFDPFAAMREDVHSVFEHNGVYHSSEGDYEVRDILFSERSVLDNNWALAQEGVEVVE